MEEVRIDKWLWATRIFKSRTIAVEACKKGRIMIQNVTVKPSRMIRMGEVIQVKKPPIVYSFKVLALADKRMGAKLVPEYMENVTTPDQYEILELQKIVRRVPVADHVVRYAMQIARLTRPHKGQAPEFIREYVSWGAGPRASQYLVLGAKARAVLYGRFYAGTEDIRAVAHPVLRHRIMTNFNAEAEGLKPDNIVDRLIETVGEGKE